MMPFLLQAAAQPSGTLIPDSDLWYWLMSAVGFPVLAIAIAAVIGAWLIWERVITPAEARAIRSAKRRKNPILFLFNDAGQGWFEPVKRLSSSGAASTSKKSSKRDRYLGYFARKTEATFEEPKGDNVPEIVADNLANYVDSLETAKIYLKDSKIPINVAYRGKALITSFMGLAGVEYAKKLSLADGGEATEVCSYCGGKNSFGTRVIKALDVPFINITRFFKNISQLTAWDESEQLANETDRYFEGMEEEKKKATKNPLLMILLAMGFCFGMAVLLVVVTYILK